MTLIAEFIDANELRLAWEQLADVLSEDEQPLSVDEREDCSLWWIACRWVIESLTP